MNIFISHLETHWAFFSAGARVNAKDNMWLTPLHRAVASRSEVSIHANTSMHTQSAQAPRMLKEQKLLRVIKEWIPCVLIILTVSCPVL